MKDFVNTRPTGLYEDAIGEKNQSYYLEKFEDFDQKGPGLHASWNWSAFFFTAFWALYRKMYGWFFVWLIVFMFFQVFPRGTPSAQTSLTMWLVNLAVLLGFTAFANSLYHAKVKARIGVAEQKSNSDVSQVRKRLSSGGGVHTWVLMMFGGIPIIGIVAAVALPAYQDYTKRNVVSAKQTESAPTSSAESTVDWDKGVITPPLPARMPIKYGKDDTPLDGQPATQQNAARANLDLSEFQTARPVDETNNRPFTYEEAISPKTQSAADQEHYRRIYAAHPDADAIHDSPAFQAWVSRYPTYQRIVAQGTTQEIIEMFTAYKNQR